MPVELAHDATLNCRVDVDILVTLGSFGNLSSLGLLDLGEFCCLFCAGHDGLQFSGDEEWEGRLLKERVEGRRRPLKYIQVHAHDCSCPWVGES